MSDMLRELGDDYWKECIRLLLIGLNFQEIEQIMGRITPENCLKIGTANREGVKRVIEERDALKRNVNTNA